MLPVTILVLVVYADVIVSMAIVRVYSIYLMNEDSTPGDPQYKQPADL